MFKKTAIVIAMATLATGSFAAELSAGKDTKFEVNVDVGSYYLSKKDATGKEKTEVLGKGMNQVEIKATHNVSADLSVFGEIEYDFDPVIDNSPLISDDTRLGIASKNFGRFSVGQFDSFYEDNITEALGVGHGENGFMTEPASANKGRHLQYTHKIGDLSFGLDLTSNNNTAQTDAGWGAAIAAVYKLGDFSVGLGYSDVAKYATDFDAAKNGIPNKVKEAAGITASYKMGNTKVMGLYATETATDVLKNVKTTYTGLALTHVMGEFDVGVSFQARDDSKKTYNEWSAGFGYTPVKNLTVYLDMNGLGLDKGEKDIVELGVKYAF